MVSGLMRALKSGPTVLFYHGVEEELVDPRVQTLHLSMHQFEQQIRYLLKHFEIVSLDDLYDCISRRQSMSSKQLAITFDDGYKNNLEVVAPFLNSWNIPFSVFVSTRHISEGERFPTYYLRAGIIYSREQRIRILDEEYDISNSERKLQAISSISRKMKHAEQDSVKRIVSDLIGLVSHDQWAELDERFSSDQPMNWGEVKELRNRGATIGSHCHDHMLLHNKQPIEEISRQLKLSRELVQEHVGECRYVAYPNGTMNDVSLEAVEKVKESDYLAGFTTIAGEVQHDMSPYVLPRVNAKISNINHFGFDIDTCYRHNRRYRNWSRKWGYCGQAT
jgi:peptidoglycan/xylan/chitin deacetylase (PgdA/CDA1 family)